MRRQHGSAAGSPRGSPKNVFGGRHTGSVAKSGRRPAPTPHAYRGFPHASCGGCLEPVLFGMFLHGLSEEVKDKLAAQELPVDLVSLIALTIRIDGRERRRERRSDCSPNRSLKDPTLHLMNSGKAPASVSQRGSELT